MSILDGGNDELGRVRTWRVICDICGTDIDQQVPGPEESKSAVVIIKDSTWLKYGDYNFFIQFTSLNTAQKPRDLCQSCILSALEQGVRALAQGKVRYERDLRRIR